MGYRTPGQASDDADGLIALLGDSDGFTEMP